ncbi:MAG: OapC/ArvC family zinc-ribbon domain-containing protein [Candidatus Heimdallarchaeaceae archaeon]
MERKVKTKTICDNCEKEVNISAELLQSGCPNCGSFKFRTIRLLSEEEKKKEEINFLVKKELQEHDVTEDISAIRLTQDGTFEVDLEQLLHDIEQGQPIISRNKDGSYHIKFIEKEKKKDD